MSVKAKVNDWVIHIQIGWFKGDQFVLFKFFLWEQMVCSDIEVIGFQVAKFMCSLWIERVTP